MCSKPKTKPQKSECRRLRGARRIRVPRFAYRMSARCRQFAQRTTSTVRRDVLVHPDSHRVLSQCGLHDLGCRAFSTVIGISTIVSSDQSANAAEGGSQNAIELPDFLTRILLPLIFVVAVTFRGKFDRAYFEWLHRVCSPNNIQISS